MARASESTHWYRRNGEPAYDLTLRHARKMGLVPGVSSILQMEAKPQLTNWLVEQALMSALTLPRLANETDDDFIHRAREDSKEQARKAAARGTAIHAAIQGAFEGKPVAAEDLPYVEPVRLWLLQRYGLDDGTAESSFASPLGYGGKIDYLDRRVPLVLDFKVKSFGPEKQGKDLSWPEHIMQLAAYGHGTGLVRFDAVNIFISSTNPGLIVAREWDNSEIAEGWEAFQLLLRLWKLRKGFDPSFTPRQAA